MLRHGGSGCSLCVGTGYRIVRSGVARETVIRGPALRMPLRELAGIVRDQSSDLPFAELTDSLQTQTTAKPRFADAWSGSELAALVG